MNGFVYHGTSYTHLNNILKHGIKPRGKATTNWPDVPSHADLVYLTTAYPFYYAMCASNETEKLVVLEVDLDALDENRLYPDEDYISECRHGRKNRKIKDVLACRDEIEDFRKFWRESLDRLGNVCYKGVIPLQAITRYVLYDFSRDWVNFAFLDPIVSVQNFKLVGHKHKGLVAWMFGDVDSLDSYLDWSPEFRKQLVGISEMYRKQMEFYEAEAKIKTGIEVVNCHGKTKNNS